MPRLPSLVDALMPVAGIVLLLAFGPYLYAKIRRAPPELDREEAQAEERLQRARAARLRNSGRTAADQ
jgi:hypothetical protein